MSKKYPRTLHLPWSPGGTKDDKRMVDINSLIGIDVVITEKMDGSNVCLTNEELFARSHSGPPGHPSFNMLKAFHSKICYMFPKGLSIFGEWCYAVHSIKYELPAYLFIFGIRNDFYDHWLSWDTTKNYCRDFGIPTVPELWRGTIGTRKELEHITNSLMAEQSKYGKDREGIVIRTIHEFHNKDFSSLIAKNVRKDHISTDQHWLSKQIEIQKLKR